MTALDFMQQLVDEHVHESDGKNRSDVIDAINREMGLPFRVRCRHIAALLDVPSKSMSRCWKSRTLLLRDVHLLCRGMLFLRGIFLGTAITNS